MNAYSDAMSRYFTFAGRSTRSQFWLYFLFMFIALLIGVVLDQFLGTTSPDGGGPVTGAIYLAHIFPAISVTIRRLHDIDRSGWWVWLGLIPLFGTVPMLIFACTASSPGINRFGPPANDKSSSIPPMSPHTLANATSHPAMVDQLEKLAALRGSGAIDDTEFQHLKNKLMDHQVRPSP